MTKDSNAVFVIPKTPKCLFMFFDSICKTLRRKIIETSLQMVQVKPSNNKQEKSVSSQKKKAPIVLIQACLNFQLLNLTELELNRVDIKVGVSGSLYYMDGFSRTVRHLRNLVSQVFLQLRSIIFGFL